MEAHLMHVTLLLYGVGVRVDSLFRLFDVYKPALRFSNTHCRVSRAELVKTQTLSAHGDARYIMTL